MLVRGWAMCGTAGIVIRSAAGNVSLFAVIRGPVTGAHLTAQEQRKPDQERGGHDQRRCQRRQIGKHPGASCFARLFPYLALLLMSAGSAGTGTQPRSEERRVGEEGRSRWSPYH